MRPAVQPVPDQEIAAATIQANISRGCRWAGRSLAQRVMYAVKKPPLRTVRWLWYVQELTMDLEAVYLLSNAPASECSGCVDPTVDNGS